MNNTTFHLVEVVSTVDTTLETTETTTNEGGLLTTIGEFFTNHKNGCIAAVCGAISLTGMWWLSRKRNNRNNKESSSVSDDPLIIAIPVSLDTGNSEEGWRDYLMSNKVIDNLPFLKKLFTELDKGGVELFLAFHGRKTVKEEFSQFPREEIEKMCLVHAIVEMAEQKGLDINLDNMVEWLTNFRELGVFPRAQELANKLVSEMTK